MDVINKSARKFDETMLIGQSNKPRKPTVKNITNKALVMIIITDHVSLKSISSSRENKRNVMMPKIRTSF